jgi:integrase
MLRAISEGILKERFRFHDLRRKTATDLEYQDNREAARKLLGHTDQKTTAIYIRVC